MNFRYNNNAYAGGFNLKNPTYQLVQSVISNTLTIFGIESIGFLAVET